ncbi:ParB/RepB/Spo0J family partition protein [Ruminiclostridium herbifermentans]|uniref:ParB/RepB/Spo0J family partition protein n=1 Tax=Ruminiclostridium herbifermentans TaxID=2488810 RepID=A0A7H1VNH4_9FIRM|nr:ParB/RepB/Spo0J family partition protein [Ruminiclostridium herbifermentans]QNU66936.1 ParB/RepB/Spo0J family partition protein [Ruminiclostridium herbifermentans]
MLQNIDINKLRNHPKNPRKELGDLTELAESIKTRGVLQNLTVVPWFCFDTGVGADDPKVQEEMGYFVVIGNRRLAAAKLAGLTELPCIVSDMDYKTQLATMLLENMQRSDLNIYEQAQGFQMMLDLGESINNISEKTGFSESTVRRRVKLLELDSDKLKKSVERGASLLDYMELDKIHDISLRNSVLDKIGTPNFKWELQSAIQKEKKEKQRAFIISELQKFAKKTEDTADLITIKNYFLSEYDQKIEVPDDAQDTEYFYYETGWGAIQLCKRQDEINERDNEDDEAQRMRQDREKKLVALRELTHQAYNLRLSFAKQITNTKAKKNIRTIVEYLLRKGTAEYFDFGIDLNSIKEYFNIEVDGDDEEELKYDDIADDIAKQPELSLFAMVYLSLESTQNRYYNWNGEYENDEDSNLVYDFLTKLGYEMSEEEKALRDGTHKLFENSEC